MAIIKGVLKVKIYIPQVLSISTSCLLLASDRFGKLKVLRCNSLQATPLVTALCCTNQGLTFDPMNTFGNLWRPKQNGGMMLALQQVNRALA